MKIEPSNGLKNLLLKKLEEKHNKARVEIHVSDLIYCLRLAFFQKTLPKPSNETELMFFTNGARRHIIIEELSGKNSEVEVEKYGIYGTIDIYDNLPIELKTTRSKISLPNHYFKQLSYYCVLCETNKGLLVILRLNNKENPWEFYKIEFSPEEMETIKNEMLEKAKLLRKALENKDISLLPKTDLLNEKGEKWKCKFCKYKIECEAIDNNNKEDSKK